MIEILSPAERTRARRTGALVGEILQTLKGRAVVGTNLLDIDRWAQAMILEAGAVSCYVDYAPSFGDGPFKHYICTSVNDAVLHGKPHDYVIADGDLVSLDLAISLDGIVADSAVSFLAGTARPPGSVAMIAATEGHGGHGPPRHGRGRLDPAKRHRLPHGSQRAHDRDHRDGCRDPDPPEPSLRCRDLLTPHPIRRRSETPHGLMRQPMGSEGGRIRDVVAWVHCRWPGPRTCGTPSGMDSCHGPESMIR